MLVMVAGLKVVGAHDLDQTSGAATQAVVESQQPAADDAGQGNVLGVVGPRPSKLVGDPPCLLVELLGRPARYRGRAEGGKGLRRQFRGDPTPPPQFVDHRQRLRPQQRWSDELLVLQKAGPARRETGLDKRARFDDQQRQ